MDEERPRILSRKRRLLRYDGETIVSRTFVGPGLAGHPPPGGRSLCSGRKGCPARAVALHLSGRGAAVAASRGLTDEAGRAVAVGRTGPPLAAAVVSVADAVALEGLRAETRHTADRIVSTELGIPIEARGARRRARWRRLCEGRRRHAGQNRRRPSDRRPGADPLEHPPPGYGLFHVLLLPERAQGNRELLEEVLGKRTEIYMLSLA
jgi:hypothetical protein